MKNPEEIFEYLKNEFGEDGFEFHTSDAGNPWILTKASSLQEKMKFLRDDPELRFDVLMCLSGVDYPNEEKLGVTYHLNSTELGHSLALQTRVPASHPLVPSVESVWKTANWHEREAYDMVGIIFEGHPNLKRILLPDDWKGHPLKKDYENQEFYHDMSTGV